MDLIRGSILAFSLSGITHLVGLVILYCIKMRLVNQRMITLNLALAEMMNSFSQVAFSSRFLHGHKDFFCLFLTIVAVVANKLIMIYLIVDRFLDIHFHMQYPLYFTLPAMLCVNLSCHALPGLALNPLPHCMSLTELW